MCKGKDHITLPYIVDEELINKIMLGINETSKNFENLIEAFANFKSELDNFEKGGK